MSEVALRAFKEFGDALAAADARGGADPAARLREQGLAYVKFALAHPARFQLMFRHPMYDIAYPGLSDTGARAFAVLEHAVRAAMALPQGSKMTPDAFGFLLATWSIVHGFAHLALGGDLDSAAQGQGGRKAVLDRFLPLMLEHLPAPPRPR
ncbi:MAG: TetR-like C-terminal domain-containing protein [Rhizomicrobium sp.]